MKNPKVNRLIGYIVMFIGFFLWYKGFHASTPSDPVNGRDPFLIGFSLMLVIGAFVWMLFKVRCPHCNKLLNLKLGNIDRCPHCGSRTDLRDA